MIWNFLLLFLAAILDIKEGKIPDWLTYGSMLHAILLSPNPITVVSILATLAIFYPFYRLGLLGGGDVKLMMALSAYRGIVFTLALLPLAALLYSLKYLPKTLPYLLRRFVYGVVAVALATIFLPLPLLLFLLDPFPLFFPSLLLISQNLVAIVSLFLLAHLLSLPRKGSVRLAPALFLASVLLDGWCLISPFWIC